MLRNTEKANLDLCGQASSEIKRLHQALTVSEQRLLEHEKMADLSIKQAE